MKKIVYMYCNLDVFNKIMSEQKFKLSDISNSNDFNELKKFYLIAKDTLGSLHNALKESTNSDNYDYLNEVINELENTIKKFAVLAVCFSECKDSKVMWLEYGDHGEGVAIGFDVDDLENLAKNYEIGFGKVDYHNLKEIDVADFIGAACNLGNDKDEYIKKSILTKDLAFMDEKEWRLYYKIDDKKQFLSDLSNLYKINCTIDNLAPPIFIDFDKSFIKEIIVGGSIVKEKDKDKARLEEIKKQIQELNPSIEVFESKISCQKSQNR